MIVAGETFLQPFLAACGIRVERSSSVLVTDGSKSDDALKGSKSCAYMTGIDVF